MNRCAAPNCRCTATKDSEYCLICEDRVQATLIIARAELVTPPAHLYQSIIQTVKAKEGQS